MRRMHIGVAGAGVLGRLLAWRLSRAGHRVTVFDPAPGPQAPDTGRIGETGATYAAGFTAAGMLSPLAELDNAGWAVAQMGWRSLDLWREWAPALGTLTTADAAWLFRQQGSLMLAHGSDSGAASRVLARLEAVSAQAPNWPRPQALTGEALQAKEPSLRPGLLGWCLPQEGQILPRAVMDALAAAPGVEWRWGQVVERLEPGRLHLAGAATQDCDWAVDVRGLGARPELPMRGVRGEVVWLQAPGVTLQRPIRLLHARHRVYVVPRPDHHFVVGASEVESEDRSPVSLKSAVELMAAAQSALPALSEARIVHMEANLRPALPDNEPHIEHRPGLLRINGLFRHGWLLAPALVEKAWQQAGWGADETTETQETEHE